MNRKEGKGRCRKQEESFRVGEKLKSFFGLSKDLQIGDQKLVAVVI
jgi:hypothetical protein